MQHQIINQRCTRCGKCITSCPMGLFELNEHAQFRPDADERCVLCGHCIAICPGEAIEIEALPKEQFPPLVEAKASVEQLQALMESRRSIRSFEEKPVPDAMVQRMLDAMATIPVGCGGNPPPVTVLNGREKIQPMIEPMMAFYRGLQKGLRSPLMRPVMRLSLGKKYRALKGFMPMLDLMIAHYDKTKEDPLTWGAPLLLLFHSRPEAISAEADTVIACTYAMLAAHAQGLGTTMIGMVPPYVNRYPKVKQALGIPEESVVTISLIAGFSKIHFERGIRRKVQAHWA